MTKLKTASVLAFERNFDFSDAHFYQKSSVSTEQKLLPVVIQEKSIRGTISNRLKNTIANDPLKLDAEVQKPNLQRVDVAMLNDDCDTLVAFFTLKIIPFTGRPSVCNDQDYQSKLLEVVDNYTNEHGFSALAKRYAQNILNARWLWRNRIGSKSISITVENKDESITVSDAKSLSLMNFDNTSAELEKLSQWIDDGLKGRDAPVFLRVKAEAIVGNGQEVYPSQELILDRKDTKSKVLYTSNDKAAMHSQKVGNAIRTIDTWYEDDAQFPIAVEPYGSVTTLGTAFRQPRSKNDFYNLFDNWILKDQAPSLEQQHYVIAILIRGGVFGESGKE
ncbi:type I-F CRISPR-associated protein Csy3 [Oligella urethralis]|uniref:type I-F CRISPR-associated protein Csy3 n=1 Tax=Oligella urethralis TaxID=90245 RepID=UPI00035C4A34|nr:type I-F CRISPR-associated protein Csy3 [Oligella urethralis]SUA67927.1 CRISPR type I-F/YPEST-associated protein Csy3 [Oligella urethralis]